MRKTLIIVGVLLAVLAAAGAGGVYYAGSIAETRFDAALERLSNPPAMVLKKVRYDRGLLGAEAETALEVSAGPQKIAIPFRHVISYAPLAAGWAQVHTEMVVPPAFKPMVDAVFKGASPLSGDTVIRFDGTEETRFESPAFTFKDPNGTASWQGIKGTLSMEGPRVVFGAAAPGLKVQNPLVNVSVQGISAKGEMSKAADEFWFGTNVLETSKLEVTTPLTPAVTADGLRISATLAEQGPGLVRWGISTDLKKLSAQDLAFSNLGYELEFGNLDRALLLKWSRTAEKLRGQEAGGEALGLFMNEMPGFLKRSPRATLKRLGAVTPWGDFKATASAVFDGKGEIPAQPLDWISRVSIEGKVDLSAGLLTWAVQQQVKERAALIANAGRNPQPEQTQMLTEKLAQVRLTRLEQTGTVVRKGERYTIEFTAVGGEPTINGKGLQEIGSLLD